MDNMPDHELLINLRKELHKFPELSGSEEMTSQRISRFLEELRPDELVCNIGGKGLAARFKGASPGPRVMVRAELDALPIDESNDFDYRSVVPGISHTCGHDGHMVIAAGVAKYFSGRRPERGELVVLFQPSEENGRGAYEVVNDPLFISLQPDYILALHNLPGFERNEVILRNDVFAMASVGMIINLKGKTSHAAEPENGISPSNAVSRILKELPLLTRRGQFRHFTLVTIIHARIGEVAFGTSPGNAVVMATLRAYRDSEMDKLCSSAEELVHEVALLNELDIEVSRTEHFPATVNDKSLNGILEQQAVKSGTGYRYIEDAFKWSEDFGWFTKKYRGLLFGIGAGKGHPELHNPDYDFPDEIIDTGVNLLVSTGIELLRKM
ncbi:MAG: amidohydrolase [Bacteroidales bacterium]